MTNQNPDPNAINAFLTPPRNQQGTVTTNTIITPNPAQQTNVQNNTATAPIPPPGIGQATANTNGTPGAVNAPNNNQVQTVLSLPPLAPYLGPFAATCRRFPATDDLAEAHRTRNTYDALFHTPGTTAADRATILNAQPPPLPMLAINQANNKAVVLHCITKFYPPLGLQQGAHPMAGATIAFMGEAPYPGALPPVVTIPINTFDDEQMWPTASDAMLQTATPTDTLLQSDGAHTALTTRIIPLPPRLVPTMLEHTNDNLPTLTQILKTIHDTALPPTQQMCALPVQFLRTASIATTTPGTTTSQLGIPLTPVQMDQTITQWASARYSFYRISTQPTIATQPPPNIPPPNQQTPQLLATGNTIPLATTPALPPHNQGTTATAQQVIDIQDDEVNPVVTTHTRTPVDPLLADIVSASVVAAFREQQHQFGHVSQ